MGLISECFLVVHIILHRAVSYYIIKFCNGNSAQNSSVGNFLSGMKTAIVLRPILRCSATVCLRN